MKKKVLALIFLVTVLSSVLVGCEDISETKKIYDTEAENLKSMFVEIERTNDWKIVYDIETKVMYAVSYGCNSYGNFTLLTDENGNPKLWDGK